MASTVLPLDLTSRTSFAFCFGEERAQTTASASIKISWKMWMAFARSLE
jgi:hypothetical protein